MQSIQRVCLVHNFYQQPGGEDGVFAAEGELLLAHGIEVTRFTLHNDEIRSRSLARTAADTVWNSASRRALHGLLRKSGAQLVHFHNTFPLISPSGYAAAAGIGIPVVQTLHNYRLICPSALLFRNGGPCEDCVGRRVAWPAMWHGCYRGSRLASGLAAGMTSIHRALGTWERRVDAFIALTEFARAKFIAGGLPTDRIFVKPNFLASDPDVGRGDGGFALFVGRLSPEKGVTTLAEAWRQLSGRIPLKIAGDGPMVDCLNGVPGVEPLGHRPPEEVLRLMHQARFLVFPTLAYEGFPLVLAEALATGLPLIASNIGSTASIVKPDFGVLVEPGSATSLCKAVVQLWDSGERIDNMRASARREYEAWYTPERNFSTLMQIYESALDRRRRSVPQCSALRSLSTLQDHD